MNLVDELLGILDSFELHRIEYAVCGGIALAIHGHPRFTKDIDLLVQAEDLDRIRAAASACGFALEGGLLQFGAGTPNERSVFRISKAAGSEHLTLDLLIVGPALGAAWNTRERVEWRGRRMAVVSRAGLVHMKRIAGRTQDFLDIEALGESGGSSGRG